MLGSNSTSLPLTQYKSYVKKLIELPIWVKQAIYSELRSDLSRCTDIQLLDLIEKNIIQLYTPKLSYQGKYLVDTHERFSLIEKDKKALLNGICNKNNLLEIAHQNHWSLKQCCLIVLELIEDGYIMEFEDFFYTNFILFITDKIKIGEFLVRTNRLTNDQLEKVICAKKCADDFGVEITFNEILVNLGYMTSKDIENVYRLSQASDERISVIDDSEISNHEITYLKDELDAISYENKMLLQKIEDQKKQISQLNNDNFELTKQVEKYTKGFVGRFFASIS